MVIASGLLSPCSAGSNSFLGLCYEYGVELTYPIPEEVSAGLLNGVSQVLVVPELGS